MTEVLKIGFIFYYYTLHQSVYIFTS